MKRREFLALGAAAPAAALAARTGKMKLSCLPVSFFDAISHRKMPLEEWLDFAAELGLDGAECGPLLVEPLGPVKPAAFRRLAEARGLPVSNYTAYSDFSNPDADAREREVKAALENIRIALELGAPSLRALTGQQRPGVEPAQGIAWVVDSIRRVAEAADKAGVRVNVENHTKAFTWTRFDFAIKSAVFLEVMDGLKDAPVGVQFDVCNPLVADEDPLALYEQVKSRIGYVHLNDAARRGVFEFVPVGSGIAPVRELLRRLARQRYTGWVSVEEQSRTGKDGFLKAVRYARRALREAADSDQEPG